MLSVSEHLFSLNGLPALIDNDTVYAISPGEKKLVSFPLSTPKNNWPDKYGKVYPYGPLNDYDAFYITVVLTPKCNLNCQYCSLSIGRGGTNVSSSAIIDYFRFLINSRMENKIIVSFFGGEPTLEQRKMHFLCESFKNITDECNKAIFLL